MLPASDDICHSKTNKTTNLANKRLPPNYTNDTGDLWFGAVGVGLGFFWGGFRVPWASGIGSNQYSQTRVDIDFFPVANY